LGNHEALRANERTKGKEKKDSVRNLSEGLWIHLESLWIHMESLGSLFEGIRSLAD